MTVVESQSVLGLANTGTWEVLDASEVDRWPVKPLSWLVEGIIPADGIGFLSGPPKERKSLLALDLACRLALPANVTEPWLGKFPICSAKTLYIAVEDPLRRIQERLMEIAASYDNRPAGDHLRFLTEPDFNLLDQQHQKWLERECRQYGIQLIILDVLNRVIPDLDENSARDMATVVSVLRRLNRELDVTILLIDHTRKPQAGDSSSKRSPSPFNLKGSVAKYGAADFMICIEPGANSHQISVFSENKDSDAELSFVVNVSPAGCTSTAKFQWVSDLDAKSTAKQAEGRHNLQMVLDAIGPNWISNKEIQYTTSLTKSAVGGHLARLLESGEIEKQGANKTTKYRRKSVSTPSGTLLTDQEK